MGKKPKLKSRLNGVLLLNKDAGITSHDCVNKVRRIINQKKVGHFGTLDPFATGVLVIGLGEGTKLSPFLTMENKEYIAGIKLGENTDTYDLDGVVTEKFDVLEFEDEKIDSVINTFQGQIDQMPPKYSAIKVKGKPLYKYAGDGIDVEIKPRSVNIHEIEKLEFNGSDFLKIRVLCSKGTYIRSIAYDIGKSLGVGGHLVSLQRTYSGEFSINSSKTIEQFSEMADLEECVIDLTNSIPKITSFYAEPEVEKNIRNGVQIEMTDLKLIEDKGTELIKVLNNEDLFSVGSKINVFEREVYKSRRVFLS